MKEYTANEITETVFKAIDEVNEQLEEKRRLSKSLSTELFGENSNIDSIWLVTLIAVTEAKIEDDFGVSLTLADERAMHYAKSPFKTIGTMVEYIGALLKEKNNGK